MRPRHALELHPLCVILSHHACIQPHIICPRGFLVALDQACAGHQVLRSTRRHILVVCLAARAVTPRPLLYGWQVFQSKQRLAAWLISHSSGIACTSQQRRLSAPGRLFSLWRTGSFPATWPVQYTQASCIHAHLYTPEARDRRGMITRYHTTSGSARLAVVCHTRTSHPNPGVSEKHRLRPV